jgi:hypothetical protein
MANSFASISNAMAILKNYYAGPIVSQFNDDLPIYRGAEKGKEKWNGLQVIRPVKVRRNQGIGAVSDGGLLPSIGQQTTQQAIIAAKFNYLRFGVTGPMIKASMGDKGSFISVTEFEITEGLNDLKSDVNRQLSWDGTGDLATVSANAVATNVVSISGRESSEAALKFLDVGVVVDILTAASTVAAPVYKAQSVTITATSGTAVAATATITLSSNVTCAATDIIVRAGSFGNEIQGLLTQQDGGTSTVFNIDRSAYPSFQGNVTDAAGGQMTLNGLQTPFNEARRRGQGKISAVYSDFDSERFYNKLLITDKRYIGKVKGDGTFSDKDTTYLEWAGVPWVADKDCPTRVFFLSENTIKKYVLAELEWADETGTYYIAQTSTDAFEARLRLFANLFSDKPSANAVLKNYISP